MNKHDKLYVIETVTKPGICNHTHSQPLIGKFTGLHLPGKER